MGCTMMPLAAAYAQDPTAALGALLDATGNRGARLLAHVFHGTYNDLNGLSRATAEAASAEMRPAYLAIARALAMDPKLMLLDEITSALDPQLVGDVLALVRRLADTGMTMIIATHEMSFAREVSDKVCFLDAGVILEEGPCDQIFTAPREQRTREFLQRVIEAGRM